MKSHAWKNRCDDSHVGSCEREGQTGLRSWKKASENSTLSQCTDTLDFVRARASVRNTAVSDRSELTLLHRSIGHRVWREKDQRRDWHCTHTRGKTYDKNTWNYRTLVTVKRRRCIERRLEQMMLLL